MIDEDTLEERGKIAIARQTAAEPVVAIVHLFVARQWTGEVTE